MHPMSAILLVAGLTAPVQVLQPLPRKPAVPQPGIVWPAPIPIAQAPFVMSVQEKPRFPKAARPDSSDAVSRGLRVTIQPEKSEFSGNGPLAFLVTFKNTSPKPFLLQGLEHLGDAPRIVFANQQTASQWTVDGKFKKAKQVASVPLKPGEEKTYTLLIDATRVVPRPIPFPRPIPRPLPKPIRRQPAEKAGDEAAPVQKRGPAQIAPPIRRRPAVFVGPLLPCGQGKIRARLLLEFKADATGRKYQLSQWIGRIPTQTVEFSVGAPQPRPIPPVVVGPLTPKARAIRLAHAAAERALQAHYKPVKGINPPHAGAWITDVEKTAQVTDRKGGGWSVRWTNLSKGGFSYNVLVDVTNSSQVIVREVFASHSPK